MEKLNVTFLGTSNAIPTQKRNHSAILISYKNENILFDCGEGTQRQFRYANISPTKITRILITHWHTDHMLGLPGLIQTLAMSQYSKTLKIYGPPGTKKFFQLIRELIKGCQIAIEINEISPGIFIDEPHFNVEAKEMEHGIATYAYALNIKEQRRLDSKKLKKYHLPNSPILKTLQSGKDIIFEGKKIKSSEVVYLEKGKKVSIILDTRFNNRAIQIAKNSDLLICEASFTKSEESKAKEYYHLTAQQAATIAKKAKVKKLILTHLSQRYEHNSLQILKEAKTIFKSVSLAQDLDQIKV